MAVGVHFQYRMNNKVNKKREKMWGRKKSDEKIKNIFLVARAEITGGSEVTCIHNSLSMETTNIQCSPFF